MHLQSSCNDNKKGTMTNTKYCRAAALYGTSQARMCKEKSNATANTNRLEILLKTITSQNKNAFFLFFNAFFVNNIVLCCILL